MSLRRVASEDALDAAIDRVLKGDAYRAVHARLLRLVPLAAEGRLPIPKELCALTESRGAKLREAMRVEEAVAKAALQKARFDLYVYVGPPMTFMHDVRLPAAIKRALLGGASGEVALFGLIALGRRRGTAPWIIDALLERWIVGRRAFLPLLAAHPAIQIPEDVLPRDQRLPVDDLLRMHQVSEQAYQDELREAREHGVECFPTGEFFDDY